MNSNARSKRWIVPLAIVLALALGIATGAVLRGSGSDQVASLVFLDVNPSIQLQLNRDEEVLAALPMNDQAREVLADMDLRETPLNVAVNAIVGSLLRYGYLSGEDAAILISVEDEDVRRAARLEESLNQSVSAAAGNALVLSQVVDAGTEVPQNGVSAGKAALIQDIQALNGALDFDALAALSLEELWQLRDAGAPGMPIGISRARYAAEAYAGTLEVSSVTGDVDPELDEAPPHYEVELHVAGIGDLDYKVDAYTGEVLAGKANVFASVPAPTNPDSSVNYDSAAWSRPASDILGGITSAECSPDLPELVEPLAPDRTAPVQTAPIITGTEARAIAFSHAGVTASDATLLKWQLNREDGIQVYEIEFRAGSTEYEYEINASDGSICKAEQDRDDDSSSGSGHHGETHHTNTSCISGDAARNAAFRHAGVSASDAHSIHCELDRDDRVYEVSFHCGGIEYEYEIDAATGAVVKAEQDD